MHHREPVGHLPIFTDEQRPHELPYLYLALDAISTLHLRLSQGIATNDALDLIVSHAREATVTDCCGMLIVGRGHLVVQAMVSGEKREIHLPPVAIDQRLEELLFASSSDSSPADLQKQAQRITAVLQPSFQADGLELVLAILLPLPFQSGILFIADFGQQAPHSSPLSGEGRFHILRGFGTLASWSLIGSSVPSTLDAQHQQSIIQAFLDDLLHPAAEESSPEVLAWRGKALGIDTFNDPYCLVLIGLSGGVPPPLPHGQIFQAIQMQLQSLYQGLFAVSNEALLTCFLKETPALASLRTDLQKLAQTVLTEYQVQLFAGISTVQREINGYRWAYREARDALLFGQKIHPNVAVIHSLDLGIVRYLDPSVFREREGDPYLDIITHIAAYDASHGTDFLATLELFLRLAGNRKETAKELSQAGKTVHYTTVGQRIERCKDTDVGGPFAFDVTKEKTHWLDLYTAIQIRKLNTGF